MCQGLSWRVWAFFHKVRQIRFLFIQLLEITNMGVKALSHANAAPELLTGGRLNALA
jgi:hypothetical protein